MTRHSAKKLLLLYSSTFTLPEQYFVYFSSTVEFGVWLSVDRPYCQVLPIGGLDLWILGVWNTCRLVRVLHQAPFRQMCKMTYNHQYFCVFPSRFGRHPVLIISVLFMLMFGLTVAFSVNVPMFSTLRFFEGFCLAGIILSLYVLSKSIGNTRTKRWLY